MSVRVIAGPAPIVNPAEIPGDHAANDASVVRMIAAAQRTIDGPSGWLGLALGKQTLEMWLTSFPSSTVLLYGPVIGAVSGAYLDPDDVEQPIADTSFRVADRTLIFKSGFSAPSTACAPDAVRLRYQAGYEAADVPAEAKEAVILMVLHMKAVGAENLFLRSEEVDGVGTFQYTVSEQAGAIIKTTCQRLLNGLKVYR